jgi:DNA-binding HxlR family transcriptional regulator
LIAPDAIPTYLELMQGLHQYQLAIPILNIVATAGSLRYRDLVTRLSPAVQKPIYTRTLSNAVQHLCDRGLITRSHRPRHTVFGITDLGRALHHFLHAMRQPVHQPQAARRRRRTTTTGGDPVPPP